MPMSILFWVLMIIWLCLAVWFSWPINRNSVPNILLFVIIALLGWKVFGSIVD